MYMEDPTAASETEVNKLSMHDAAIFRNREICLRDGRIV